MTSPPPPADRSRGVRPAAEEARRRLNGYVLSLVHNWIDADDIVQDVAVRLWQRFDDFMPDADFGAWACRRLLPGLHASEAPGGSGSASEHLFAAAVTDEIAEVSAQAGEDQETCSHVWINLRRRSGSCCGTTTAAFPSPSWPGDWAAPPPRCTRPLEPAELAAGVHGTHLAATRSGSHERKQGNSPAGCPIRCSTKSRTGSRRRAGRDDGRPGGRLEWLVREVPRARRLYAHTPWNGQPPRLGGLAARPSPPCCWSTASETRNRRARTSIAGFRGANTGWGARRLPLDQPCSSATWWRPALRRRRRARHWIHVSPSLPATDRQPLRIAIAGANNPRGDAEKSGGAPTRRRRAAGRPDHRHAHRRWADPQPPRPPRFVRLGQASMTWPPG